MVPENSENTVVVEAQPVAVQKHRLSFVMPIIILSYVGVSIRLSLAFLGNINTPLDAAFWPNLVGCFIMGFVIEQKIRINHQYAFRYFFCLSIIRNSHLDFLNYILV